MAGKGPTRHKQTGEEEEETTRDRVRDNLTPESSTPTTTNRNGGGGGWGGVYVYLVASRPGSERLFSEGVVHGKIPGEQGRLKQEVTLTLNGFSLTKEDQGRVRH